MPVENSLRFSDTHCHLDLPQFEADLPAVIGRAFGAGVRRILIPALSLASSNIVVQLAGTRAGLYAAIGVHPNEAKSWEAHSRAALRELAQTRMKIAAIGEIGLDYYWDTSPQSLQREILKQQLQLAQELDLPVVIHMREPGDADEGTCSSDLLKILADWAAGLKSARVRLAERPGVLHSFSGSAAVAQQALALGFCIGVTGPITFKNAGSRRQVIGTVPLDRLLIETDAPFQAPVPFRGKRNEPAFVGHIADKIAEILSRPPQEVAAATTRNAARLFSWGDSFLE
jgi:TatD DNase family protein